MLHGNMPIDEGQPGAMDVVYQAMVPNRPASMSMNLFHLFQAGDQAACSFYHAILPCSFRDESQMGHLARRPALLHLPR